MTYIRWVGGVALLGAAGVAAILSSANAGDAVVHLRLDPVVLTGPQLSSYASWASGVWPDATPAQVSDLRCCRDRLCTIRWRVPTLSASAYNDHEDSGRVYRRPAPDQIASDGSEAYRVELSTRTRLDWDDTTGTPDPQGELAALGAITAPIFGVAASVLQCVHIWTVYDPDDHSIVERRAEALITASRTPVERLVCLRDGTCAERLGTVGVE